MAMNPKLADGAEVVAGPAADDAAASGNPVPVGGIYNSTKPTYTALDRTQLQSGSRGALMVEIWGPNANATPLVTVGQDGISSGGNTWFFTSSQGMLFSGSVNSNRAREVVNAADSTGTGIAAAGLLAQFDETSIGTVTENQFGNLRMAGNRGLVTRPYGTAAEQWSYAAATGGISNTTTAVTVKGAVASMRNYVTSMQVQSDALGAATEIAIRDGAGGTVLWRGKIATTGWLEGRDFNFPVPLQSTANTLLEVITLTATVTGGVFFNLQGYTAA